MSQIYENKGGKKNDDDILTISNEKILKSAKKWHIQNIRIESEPDSESITEYHTSKKLKIYYGKMIFFYQPSRTVIYDGLYDYLFNLEEDVKTILGIRPTLNYLNEQLESKGIIATDALRPFTLEAKKIRRIEEFYKILSEFTLSVMHLFYWQDFEKGKKNPINLKEIIEIVFPLTIKIKDDFEKFIHAEDPRHAIEKNMEL